MKLQFDTNQQFQRDAVAAVADFLDGQAQVVLGVVQWPNGADLAPDAPTGN